MSSPKLLYTNQVLSALAFTASNPDTVYPATNLLETNYAQVFRSNYVPAATLVIDLGSAKLITAFAMGNYNFTQTGVITLEGNSADSWGAPAFSQSITLSTLNASPRAFYRKLTTPQTFRYWRLVFNDTNLSSVGYFQIGCVYLGGEVQLDDSINSSNSRVLDRNSITLNTEYDQTFVYDRDYGWDFSLQWDSTTDALKNAMEAMHFAVKGPQYPYFLVLDPREEVDPLIAETYYVRNTSPLEENRQHFNVWGMRLTVKEERTGITIPRL